ncbi:MAG: hypothetical protein FH759_08715 [Sediminimonas qiaohouensis]|uniref:Uncharacterized protein n=1 Tax=Sediminimonas qiaohouensis TaxID=552061 RepID=A0A7C9LS48_9RHOB|nr:hypothetical protein [Sediminimonas qiaohouensis]MTJ04756.1 hypothetical protein [Sediminimonas qiaohouensis]
MSRPFIAAVVAASLALSGLSATTAQAGNRDVARAIAGIAAVAIIAGALSDRDNRRNRGHVTRRYDPDPVVIPRPLPRRVQRHSLPRHCMIRAQSRYGEPRRVFGSRCLNRHFRYTDSLPRACAVRIGGNHHRHANYGRHGYSVGCLRQHGYHLAHR